MNPKSIFLIFLSVLIFTQCKKEAIETEPVPELQEVQEEVDECKIVGPPPSSFGDYIPFSPAFPMKSMPHFNPSNSDEFIFTYWDDFLDNKLIKYNLETNESQILLQGQFRGKPRWGKNGWILLTISEEGDNHLDYEKNIYKIRDNGEDLTKLSSCSNCFGHIWDMESEKILYRLGWDKSLLVDTDGNVLDTLFEGSGSSSSWQHSKYMAVANGGLRIFDPYDGTEGLPEYEHFYEQDALGGTLKGAEWLDEERIIWCQVSGIYISNIVTKQTQMIGKNCSSDYLQRPTYAPDINKVIFERVQLIEELEGSGVGNSYYSLYMMNLDGTEGGTIDVE